MADISLIDPYSAQQESIARQRRMAQALQQQAQAPMEMPQTPGVLISPYAGLAKVLQGAYGGYQEAEADKEYRNLVNEARTNQASDFASVIGALSAPGREGVAEQKATQDILGWTRPLGLDTSGTEMFEDVAPVQGQPAIARQEPIAPGYISPELIASLKDPSMRQFAMAQAMAKLEPKAPISVAPGGTLLDARTLKPVFTANAAPQRPVALGEGQELRDVNGKLLATGPTKTATATPLSKLAQLQAEYDAIAAKDKNDPRLAIWKNAIAKESEDQNLAFNREKFEWEKGNQGYKLEKVRNQNGEEVLMAVNSAGIARPVRSGTGEIVMSAAPTKMVHVEIEAADGSRKMVVMPETDPRFTAGVALRGPEYVSITTVNAQGMPEIRQVKKDDEILKTGYVKPLDGFLGQLQQAGVPMDKIQSDPKIRDLVDRYFVKTAGGVAPEEAAGFELRKAEVVARLGELGIAIPANIKGLSLSVTPGVLGGTQSSSAAPAAANGTKAAPLPLPSKTSDYKTGQYYLTNKGVLLFNGSKFVD